MKPPGWPAGRRSRDRIALVAALAVPAALAAVLAVFRGSFPSTDAALALLLTVVAVAANGSRPAGFLAALSAAAWFDFFFTRPYERFSITRREYIETTVLLLLIGGAVTELAAWGRRQHTAAVRRAGYLDGIRAAAEAVASSGSPPALIEQVSAQLIRLLSLQSCVFQYGTAGLGGPGRLLHDGRVTVRGSSWDADTQGLPPNTEAPSRERRHSAGPVPDEPGARHTPHAGAAAGRRRAGGPGGCRHRRQPAQLAAEWLVLKGSPSPMRSRGGHRRKS